MKLKNISMALLAHVDFLAADFEAVFDRKLFQGDFERCLIELGHLDIVQAIVKECSVKRTYRVRGSEVVKERVVARLIEKLMRKGLISYSYNKIKDSCYFMDVSYYTPK